MSEEFRLDAISPGSRIAAEVGLARQVMSSDLMTRSEGVERGVRCVMLQNDRVAVEVIVDRGLDIGAARVGQMPVAWRSPTEVVAPWLLEQRGFEFFRGFFGGLLTTCGLDHIGNPASRPAGRFGYENRRTEDLPMHGRVSGIPARLTSYGVEERNGRLEAWVAGEVTQVAVFGEHLTLSRRIALAFGSSRIEIEDVVTNRGYATSPLALMYHVNVGWPVLAPGARVEVGGRPVGGDRIDDEVERPERGAPQKVCLYAAEPDQNGKGTASIRNNNVDGLHDGEVVLTWDVAALPSLVRWQVANVAGHYVLGLEPCTALHLGSGSDHLFPMLEPGEAKVLGVTIDLRRTARHRERDIRASVSR